MLVHLYMLTWILAWKQLFTIGIFWNTTFRIINVLISLINSLINQNFGPNW